jgi:hypothetical protein
MSTLIQGCDPKSVHLDVVAGVTVAAIAIWAGQHQSLKKISAEVRSW